MTATWKIFLAFATVRALSSLFNSNIISDCDEAMNYWEPTHYLLTGKGLQTWEYSPEFGLRSYAYVGAHALIGRLFWITFGHKLAAFFGVRIVLGLCSAACETFFCTSITRFWGQTIGLYSMLFLMFSPGMFISSTAFLPSSTSMYFIMLAFAFWMRKDMGWAVISVAAATLLGWPFCVVLTAPLALHSIYRMGFFKTLLWAASSLPVLATPGIIVDYFFYHKFIIPPLNIILYNVFTPHGADLYGVEPWTYYIINGSLNFNLAFPLAFLSVPALFLASKFSVKQMSRASVIDGTLILLPFYIWMSIMLRMAHKEERFLYVIYPLICLAAAVTLHSSVEVISYTSRSIKMSKSKTANIISALYALIQFLFIVFFAFSASRIVSNTINYSAPLFVYNQFNNLPTASQTVDVCVSKEWYRFPSHFFLPQNHTLRFLRSGFGGQLPQLYNSTYGTSVAPPGFNDMNREETNRYFDISKCDYLVDLQLPEVEEYYFKGQHVWEDIYNRPFLISSHSNAVTRALWIPFLSSRKNTFANYSIFRNTKKSTI